VGRHIDFLTMHPEARRRVTRILGEIEAASAWCTNPCANLRRRSERWRSWDQAKPQVTAHLDASERYSTDHESPALTEW